MTRRSRTLTRAPRSPGGAWVLRCAVLLALALTLWFAGPRASEIIAARIQLDRAAGPPIELGRVGFLKHPDWMQAPLLIAVMLDLEPSLRGRAAIMDEPAALALRDELQASPWVANAVIERVFPDRFRVSMTLRRPVLGVHLERVGELIALVDRDGRCLPPVSGLDLPRTVLTGGWRPPSHRAPTFAELHPDPAVVAAAQVAVEWQEQVAVAVPEAPPLAEVDGSNVGYRALADGRYPEVQVLLQRSDGEFVPLAYGHHPGSRYKPLPLEVKIDVLRKILAAHPGLVGLTGGDLRFANRWEQYLRPYRGSGPWGYSDK